MESKLYHIVFWITFMCTPNSSVGSWPSASRGCKDIKPLPRDIIKRMYAVLPYYDREGQNPAFLQQYRLTINKLSESNNPMNREAAFYAAILTPLVFLERYRDAKCLLERNQQALEEFQKLHPKDKRTALKSLYRLRDISRKIAMFVTSVPDHRPPTRTVMLEPQDDEETGDRTDIQYVKELIKNIG